MARLLQRAFQSEGYAVSLAFDGDQALAMGMAGGLDVMVLDVMLPRRDGFNVIQNLRAAKQTVPTIMVTARDAMSDVVRGLDAGADDYLTKPFALDVLLARVRALSRRGRGELPRRPSFRGPVARPAHARTAPGRQSSFSYAHRVPAPRER